MTTRNNVFRILPKETYQRILLDLEPKELIKECQIDSYSNTICMKYDTFWWDKYIAKWYNHKHPNDYGYSTWSQVINAIKPNNLFEFLKFLDYYGLEERANIDIIITDIKYPDHTVNYIRANSLYKMKTKVFIDDTVGDLLDKINRLYDLSPYKNNQIEYIKIVCYGRGIIDYNTIKDSIEFYSMPYGKIQNLRKLNIDTKLNDITYFGGYSKKNFFLNLQQFGMVIIKL